MKLKNKKRIIYSVLFVFLIIVEVLIALFVDDSFIRPFGGDIIVAVVVYCFARIFFPNGVRLMPLYVFLFCTAIEFSQYINLVTLLGLQNNRFFSTIMGMSFSWYDELCYLAGCLICAVAVTTEHFIQKNKQSVR